MSSDKTFRYKVALLISGSGVTSPRSLKKAEAILALIESDLIGADEMSIDPLWAGKQGYWAKNELRSEQRKLLQRGTQE